MNNRDAATPRSREQVAALLPTGAARQLVGQPPFVQATAVDAVAMAVARWELAGVTLDPVAFDAVVTSLVIIVKHLALAAADPDPVPR